MASRLQAVQSKIFEGLSATPPVSRSLCIATLVGWLLSLTEFYGYIALTPAFVVPPHIYIWTFFTAAFAEPRFITAVVCAMSILMIGKFIEPLWGGKELARFISIVNVGTNVATFLVIVLAFRLYGEEQLIYAHCGGLIGVLAGSSVVFKQLTPEYSVNMLVVSVRTKHFPSAIILLCLLLAVFRISPPQDVLFVWFGIVTSWVYLRFFQPREGSRGDLGDVFSLASFFPEAVQPAVNKVSTSIYGLLQSVHIVPPWPTNNSNTMSQQQAGSLLYTIGTGPTAFRPVVPAAVSSSQSQIMTAATPIPIGDAKPVDAERRRQLALKALDMRLGLDPNEQGDNQV
ncbi:hypothetical protein CAOG_004290, partial [Capsaspora owczarzaki ATCC 30864]